MPKKKRARINLVQTASRLAEQSALWEPLVEYDPISRYYARLAAEPEFEAWLLTWAPGQDTDWHDHGGSAGAFVTVRGTSPSRTRRSAPRRRAHRLGLRATDVIGGFAAWQPNSPHTYG